MVALPRAAICCLAVAAAIGHGDTAFTNREANVGKCKTPNEEPLIDAAETHKLEEDAEGDHQVLVGVPILRRKVHPNLGGTNIKGISVQQITPIDTKRHDSDSHVLVNRDSFDAMFRTAEGPVRRARNRFQKRRNMFSSTTQSDVRAQEAIQGAEEVRQKWAELYAHVCKLEAYSQFRHLAKPQKHDTHDASVNEGSVEVRFRKSEGPSGRAREGIRKRRQASSKPRDTTPTDTKRHDTEGDMVFSRDCFDAFFRTAQDPVRRAKERLRKRRDVFSSTTQTSIKAGEPIGKAQQDIPQRRNGFSSATQTKAKAEEPIGGAKVRILKRKSLVSSATQTNVKAEELSDSAWERVRKRRKLVSTATQTHVKVEERAGKAKERIPKRRDLFLSATQTNVKAEKVSDSAKDRAHKGPPRNVNPFATQCERKAILVKIRKNEESIRKADESIRKAQAIREAIEQTKVKAKRWLEVTEDMRRKWAKLRAHVENQSSRGHERKTAYLN